MNAINAMNAMNASRLRGQGLSTLEKSTEIVRVLYYFLSLF